MEGILSSRNVKDIIKISVFDVLAVTALYLVPVLSHLTSLPIYFIEPMRLMVILAIVHTSKRNAYILGLTLPLFSFLVSAHPVFLKTVLITGELVFMTWMYYSLADKMKNNFGAMFLSIGLSKIAYYSFKFLLISAVLIEGSLISTPLMIQVITTILFSSYIFLLRK